MKWICCGLLVFSVVFICASCQVGARLAMYISCDLGHSHATVPQIRPANWQDRFQPSGGSMRASRYDHAAFWDIGAGFEPIWEVGTNWELGLPVYYSFTFIGEGEQGSFTRKKTVALTTVDWWDAVSLLEVKLEKKSPAAGISLFYNHWKFQWVLQKYRIFVQDFLGVDRPGGTNTSKVVGEQEVERDTGYRLDIGYRAAKNDPVSYGIYYERNGAQVWILGIGLKLGIPL